MLLVSFIVNHINIFCEPLLLFYMAYLTHLHTNQMNINETNLRK